MTVSKRWILITVGAAVLAFAAGCGQPPEQEGAGGAETQTPTPTATPDAPTSGVAVIPHGVSISRELPANFPSDVPQHPKAEILQSRATNDMGLAISMLVKDDADTVASFYADSLAADGWTTDIRQMPDSTTIFADKGNRNAAVMVRESDRGTQVDMILAEF